MRLTTPNLLYLGFAIVGIALIAGLLFLPDQRNSEAADEGAMFAPEISWTLPAA